jgi:hypothetical protein
MTNECPLIRYCDTADRALFYSEVFNAERALGKNPFLLVCGSTGGGAGSGPGSASDNGPRGVSDEGGNQGARGFDKGCGTYGTSNGARDGANARDGAGGGANGSISTVQSESISTPELHSTVQSESISTPELHSTAPPSVMTWLANLKLNLHANFGSGRVRRVSEELTATLGHAMEGDLQSKVRYRGVPLDMDVIDTSWMDSNVHALRHNYFNVNRWMLDDIRDTVVTRRRAHLRAGGLTHRRGNVWSFVGAPKYIVNP